LQSGFRRRQLRLRFKIMRVGYVHVLLRYEPRFLVRDILNSLIGQMGDFIRGFGPA
jgi:hypothetical protein